MISSSSAMSDPIIKPIDEDFKEIKGQIETGKAKFGDVASKEGKQFRSEVQKKIEILNNKIADTFKNKSLSEPAIDALISLRSEFEKINNEIKTVDTRIVDHNKAFKPAWYHTFLSWFGLGPKPEKTVDFIRDDLITSGIQGVRKRLAEETVKHSIDYSSSKELLEKMDKMKDQLPSGSFALYGLNPRAIGVKITEKENSKNPTFRTYAIILTDKGYKAGEKIYSTFTEALKSIGALKELQVVEKELEQEAQQKQLKLRMDVLTDSSHFVKDCTKQAEAESTLKNYDKGVYIVWKDDKGYHLSGKNQQGKVEHSDINFDSFVKAKGTLAEFIKDKGFSKPVGAIKVAEFFTTIKPLLDTHPESSAEVRANDVLESMERGKSYFLLREAPGKRGIELITLKKVKPWLMAERAHVDVKTFTVSGDGKIAGESWEQFQNTAMKELIPLRSIESRSELLGHIQALGSFTFSKENEITSRMQQFVDVMGAKANGCYGFYKVKSKTNETELRLCYVQAGKVLTKSIDITSDSAVKEFNVLSGDSLLSKLLEKASIVGLERAKGFSVVDKDMHEINSMRSALGTKEHIQSRDVALADLQNVIKTFGDKAYGAYVLYDSPEDKGKVIARVYEQTGEKEYTLDLAANPGSITIGKEVVKELPKWAVQGCKLFNDQIAEFDRLSRTEMPGYFDSGTSQGASQVQDMFKHASLMGINNIWFVHRMPYQSTYTGSMLNPLGLIMHGVSLSINYGKNLLGLIPKKYSLTVAYRQGNEFKMVEKEIFWNPATKGFTLDKKPKKDMAEAVDSLFSEKGIPTKQPKMSAAEIEERWTMIDAKERMLAKCDAKVGKDVGKLFKELDNSAVRHYNIAPKENEAVKLSQSFSEAGKTENREFLLRNPTAYTLAWGNNKATIDIYAKPGKYTVDNKEYDTVEEMVVGVTGQRNMKSLAVGLEEKREAEKAEAQKRLKEAEEANTAEAEEEIESSIARDSSEIDLPDLSVTNDKRWVQVGSRLAIAHNWWLEKGEPQITKEDAVLLLRQILAMPNKEFWGKGGQLDKLANVVETAKEVEAKDMGLEDQSDEVSESQNEFLDFLVTSAGIG